MSRDQVSGRKNSAILSMMVCRIESRFSDEVRAFATSLNMASSCICLLRSGTAASLIERHILRKRPKKGKNPGTSGYYKLSFFKSATSYIARKPESNSTSVPKTVEEPVFILFLV